MRAGGGEPRQQKRLPVKTAQRKSRSLISLYWIPHLANEKHHVAGRQRVGVMEGKEDGPEKKKSRESCGITKQYRKNNREPRGEKKGE